MGEDSEPRIGALREGANDDEESVDETIVGSLSWNEIERENAARAPLDLAATVDEGAAAARVPEAPTPGLDQTSNWSGRRGATSSDAIGKVVAGRYLLGPVLGEGGMGTVFRAEHTDLGKRVAIKVLATSLDGEAEATARFLREAKAASTIDSEHIAQVFDVGEDIHLGLYMVMELLKGEDLARMLALRGPLPAQTAAGVVWQVCLALERAHSAGVVHRDLKPANLFLTRGDDGSVKVKVLDFGIAKLVHEARSRALGLTQRGLVLGTPHYMSPEQAQGLETVDHRTDMYSLGALLFEAIAGSPPFPALETYEATLYKILSEQAPRLSSRVAAVPPALDDLIARLMSRDPALRPSSAKEVRRRLAAIYPALGRKTLQIGASVPSVPAPVVTPPRTGTGGGVTVDPTANAAARSVRRPHPALLFASAALAGTTLAVALFAVRGSSRLGEAASDSGGDLAVTASQEPPYAGEAPAPPATGVARLLAADQDIVSLVQLAQRALERGDTDQARDLASDATHHDPTRADGWLTLGAALEKRGDTAGARAAYRSCKEQAQGDRVRECSALLAREP